MWYHFERVVMWPLRSTLPSCLFWLVWLNFFQIAPRPPTNMQCPSTAAPVLFQCFILINVSGKWPLIETLFHYLWPRVDTWVLRVDLITFWQSCHATFKVNFGLWPLLVGLIKSNGNKNIIPTIFFSLSECIRFSNICVPHIWMKKFIQNACNVSFWCAAGWFCYIITQNMTCYSNAFLFWLWPTSQK